MRLGLEGVSNLLVTSMRGRGAKRGQRKEENGRKQCLSPDGLGVGTEITFPYCSVWLVCSLG